jgi:hypothetical protein
MFYFTITLGSIDRLCMVRLGVIQKTFLLINWDNIITFSLGSLHQIINIDAKMDFKKKREFGQYFHLSDMLGHY